MINIARPVIGEEEKAAVMAVLESGQLAQGKVVEDFENAFAEYCGVKHAIATSNGTTALHVAILANEIGPGDEVITTPFTFIASANSVVYAGAKPVFVDIDPVSYNIDPDLIEAAITPRTRAIMPVDLFGNPAQMAIIQEIADRHGLLIIEDAAQAHGAEENGRRAGSWGTGCFSFYPTKNITTGEGGMVTTNDDCVADRSRLLRSHGMRVRYHHESIGFNFRMTNIHAAIGLAQIPSWKRSTSSRIANAAYLSEHLPKDKVAVPQVRPGTRHVFHQYTVRVLPAFDRDRVRKELSRQREWAPRSTILSRPQQQIYLDMGYGDQSFPRGGESGAASAISACPPRLYAARPGNYRRGSRRPEGRIGMGTPALGNAVKVAVIGAGSMGRNHLRVLNDLEAAYLVAVADANETAAQQAARRYGITPYTDYEALLDKEEPEAVVVAVPTSLHRQVTLAAISRGVNVLVEKPLAFTIEEGREMIEAARRGGVILTVGHIERYNPAILELRKRLDRGELGRVFHIHARRLGPFPPGCETWGW